MKKKNKLLKSQKGSISMFVIISLLFVTFVLVGIYTSYANKLKAQEEQVGEIKENYGQYTSEEEMDKIYTDKTQSTAEPAIGDYVTYNVSYTDMYTNYAFTADNGWRILDTGTSNGDGTYSGVKLISTGIPAKLHYNLFTNIGNENNGWWGTDTQVEELYGSTYSTGYSNYQGRYATAGLINNFTSIPFVAGTSTEDNKGSFIKINSIDSDSTTGNIFLAAGASGVHNLTLEELNTARKLEAKDTSSTQTIDADTGLFYLKNLESENNQYGYSTSTSPMYWLASPYTTEISMDTLIAPGTENFSLLLIDNNGMTTIHEFSETYGIRPVIELNTKIKAVSDGHWKII